MQVCWVIQKWDPLLSWRAGWNWHHFLKWYFIFMLMLFFPLCGRICYNELSGYLLQSYRTWPKLGWHWHDNRSTEMGLTDGNGHKINVLWSPNQQVWEGETVLQFLRNWGASWLSLSSHQQTNSHNLPFLSDSIPTLPLGLQMIFFTASFPPVEMEWARSSSLNRG